MEIEVVYNGTETEQKLAELEGKTKKQRVSIDDEILKKAIEKRLVEFQDGLMRRLYAIDANGNMRYQYSSGVWKYNEWGRIPDIVLELVKRKEAEEKDEKEQEKKRREAEIRQKELELDKEEARVTLSNEIAAMEAKISKLEEEVKKYKDAEERRRKKAEEAEEQEKIRRIEAKGFKQIEWDSEKYKEVDEYFDDYETLERIRLIDDDASAEQWKDRDTEEVITVYSAVRRYFVE